MAAPVGNWPRRRTGLDEEENGDIVAVSVGEVGPVDVVASVGVVMAKTLKG
jgi:hypothetical protein